MDDLDTAADLFALGELGREDLPMVAAEALARGLDSPALIELACLHRTDTRDAPDLFHTALAELGLDSVSWPEREAAILLRHATQHAERLLSGAGDPVENLARTATYLSRLMLTDTPQHVGLGELVWDFDFLLCCVDDGYGARESVIDDARHGCRRLLAGPPYAPIDTRIVTADQAGGDAPGEDSRRAINRWSGAWIRCGRVLRRGRGQRR
ncbi:hypothetical protein ACFVVM_27205 [Nocardia sp. NPDC058176]|uniref:hypothetical protein n=1 Tax=Nocardia sp. NPDC058176 TaxID=3346368 RepID=UPI0036DA0D15